MWKYSLHATVALIVIAIVAFLVLKKKEKFSMPNFLNNLPAALNDLVKSKPELSKKGLTAAITNLAAKENPKPNSPKAGFETLLGEEADDSKYTPGFYKIQKRFPALTKRKPRMYDLEG
jgi:hypothetical protein